MSVFYCTESTRTCKENVYLVYSKEDPLETLKRFTYETDGANVIYSNKKGDCSRFIRVIYTKDKGVFYITDWPMNTTQPSADLDRREGWI